MVLHKPIASGIHEILNGFGGYAKNSLKQVIDQDEDYFNQSSPSTEKPIHNSPYHDKVSFNSYMDNNQHSLNVFSSNAESLPQKIDKLKLLLSGLNKDDFILHIICIQECWLNPTAGKDLTYALNLLKLHDYHMYFKGSNIGKKGGLITYVHSTVKSHKKIPFFNKSNSDSWEGLTIEIEFNDPVKKYMIHNVYRPPRDNKHRDFIDEFKTYAKAIKGHKIDSILLGDLNYDIKLADRNEKIKEYLSIMLGNKMKPLITLPTKFNDKSCKILDHIFCRLLSDSVKTDACILTPKISDHQPIIASIGTNLRKTKRPEFREVYDMSSENVSKFLEGLGKSILETEFPVELHNDPNESYDKLISLINTNYHEHIKKRE
jgi:exonuclease III